MQVQGETMPSNAFAAYLESEIMSADPVELIQILYKAGLEAVGQARHHLQHADIASRSREITRASAILTELSLAVDRESGGPLSRNLIELYDYMQRLLIEANVEQSEPPLAEVGRLLATLLEAWMNCRQHQEAPRPEPWQETSEIPPAELTAQYARQSWSF